MVIYIAKTSLNKKYSKNSLYFKANKGKIISRCPKNM